VSGSAAAAAAAAATTTTTTASIAPAPAPAENTTSGKYQQRKSKNSLRFTNQPQKIAVAQL
jgi:hypothetical protein